SQFEMDMECELDQLITDYANEHLSGNVKRPAVPTISCQEYLKICEEDEMPPLVDNDDNIGNDAKDSSKDGTRDWEAFIPLKQPKLEFKQPSEKLTTIEEMETDVVIPEAMFVENCHVKQESLKIEKTGKEKRRERQKMRKIGVDPNEQPVLSEDIFLPVQCAVCSTNVAVLDHEEVYHFFNVLTGYA
ncbi:hypothetical protein Angca_009523, partial [Angiostrongylus cantonensis]